MTESRIDGPLPDTSTHVGTYRSVVPYIGRALDLTILSDRIKSVLTHWLTAEEVAPSGRDTLHTEPHCEWCAQGRAIRWKGFVMAWDHEAGLYCLPTFSYDAASLLLRMAVPPKSLRGLAVRMCRLGKSNRNPIWWTDHDRKPLSPLPAAPDILPSLIRMFGPELVKILARQREEQEGLS